MNLTFFMDEPNARDALAVFAKSAANVTLMSSEGTRHWDGELPNRVGDCFYNSPWVLYSSSKRATPIPDLSAFSAEHFKNPNQVGDAFQVLADSVDWSIFSWGGYARYGMLGLVAPVAVVEMAGRC